MASSLTMASLSTFVATSAAYSIIDNLVSTAYSYFSEGRWPKGMESELERLQEALPHIQTVLVAVEKKMISDPTKALDTWLWRFRDAVEEAENVLAELEYFKLEEKVQAPEPRVRRTTSGNKKKIVSFFNDGTMKRLREATKKLDRAAAGAMNFLQLAIGLDDHSFRRQEQSQSSRETSALLCENTGVLGRDKEKKAIIDWLAKDLDGGSESASLDVFAIVGIGGLGKTSLAQLVCHEERVRQWFDKIIWVYVSERFDVKSMTRKILEQISKESYGFDSLSALQHILSEELHRNKFLLILDDVWNDDNVIDWQKLVAPLRYGKQGSKILLTTRMESVADMVASILGGGREYLKLGGLGEKEYLMLFNNHAFAGLNVNDHQHLQTIGKEIAAKLGGCPLVAKLMGGLLNSRIDDMYWKRILEDDVMCLEQGKIGIMAVLRLSYFHLPSELQLCFRYCSIFPKNYKFCKERLVHMWMASGLIYQARHRKVRPEDVGEEYFDLLTKKSFFECESSDTSEVSEKYYVMHDLLHDLAQSVSFGECMRVEGDGLFDIPKTVRHISVESADFVVVRKISGLKNLRTLLISFKLYDPEPSLISEVLNNLKSLRLFSLTARSLHKLPDAIGDLIHLRYLSLKQEQSSWQTLLDWFPQSVYKLYNLEVLEFIEATEINHDDVEVVGMSNLVNLRHLYVSEDIMKMIPWIGKLTSIQELNTFHIRNERGYKIGELKGLANLRELSIGNLQNAGGSIEASEVGLYQKANLLSLSLGWSGASDSTDRDEQLLDGLQPHANLKKLKIYGFHGIRSPVWMSSLTPINLTYVVLCDCSHWEELPPLGKLPLLNYLQLKRMRAIRQLGNSLYGNDNSCVFPSLKVLKFESLDECTEWAANEHGHLFPQLDTLEIEKCPRLRVIPTLPLSLSRLKIGLVGLSATPGMNQQHAASPKPLLSSLDISECPGLTSLDGCLIELHDQFHALESLSIIKCEMLEYLLIGWFEELTSLKRLTILECPQLTTHSMEHPRLAFSLQELTIGSCGAIGSPLLSSLQNLTSLTRMRIDSYPDPEILPPADVLARLTMLCELDLMNCQELASLEGIQSLTSLKKLRICKCPRLNAVASATPEPTMDVGGAGSALKLKELQIDHHSLLLVEPLRSLNSAALHIMGDSHLTSLPERWLLRNCTTIESLSVYPALSLRSLPPYLERLCSLESLELINAPLITSIPNLPEKVNNLCITDCSTQLSQRCQRDIGEDWPKIARIPNRKIVPQNGQP